MSASRRFPRELSAYGSSLARFAALSAGAVATAAILVTFQEWLLALFTSVGWGFAGLGAFRGVVPEHDRRSGWLSFLGLFLISGAGIVAAGQQQYPLVGWAARAIPVQAAPDQWLASTYTFTDGRVLADEIGEAPVFGRQGTVLGTAYVAPVVADDWRPGQAVHVWAVASDETYRADTAQWARPARAGIRVTSYLDGEYQTAIQAAEQAYGLTTATNHILIRWTDQPEAEAWSDRLRLAAAVLISSGLWAVSLIGLRVWMVFKP